MFQSPLNSTQARLAHATVSLYADRLELAGAGVIPSRVLRFTRRADDAADPQAPGGGDGGRRRRQLTSVCPAEHPLQLSTDTLPAESIHGSYAGGWKCDGCGAAGEPTEARWVCTQCKHDLCGRCSKSNAIAKSKHDAEQEAEAEAEAVKAVTAAKAEGQDDKEKAGEQEADVR